MLQTHSYPHPTPGAYRQVCRQFRRQTLLGQLQICIRIHSENTKCNYSNWLSAFCKIFCNVWLKFAYNILTSINRNTGIYSFSTYVCMYVCMYICMYVCMYVSIYVYMYVCMYVCVYVCMYVCMCVCVSLCMYVCICAFLYVCMNVCMCVCGPFFMYVCMYVYY